MRKQIARGKVPKADGGLHDMSRSMLQNARDLRKNMTPHERRLWYFLQKRNCVGFKFRRQFVIERYIVDFVCLEKKVIVELDGSQHNNLPAVNADAARDKWLTSQGFKVLRFWNHSVASDIDNVVAEIARHLSV